MITPNYTLTEKIQYLNINVLTPGKGWVQVVTPDSTFWESARFDGYNGADPNEAADVMLARLGKEMREIYN